MPDRIYPAAGVGFNTPLGYDDSDFRALKVDPHGRQQVRGENQLFSFKGVLATQYTGAVSGANGYADSPAVPAGELWVVTTIGSTDATRAVTEIVVLNRHNDVNYRVDHVIRAFAAGEYLTWGGHMYLDAGDVIRVYFTGSQVGDTAVISLTGYRMTVEA